MTPIKWVKLLLKSLENNNENSRKCAIMDTKMYIAVLNEFPDHMTPTLVAHAVLGAHLKFSEIHLLSNCVDFRLLGLPKYPTYIDWLENSFKKVTVCVNQKEFDKIAALSDVYIGHEKNTLDGRDSCAVVCPMPDKELPNVLKFAKLWKPNCISEQWKSFDKVLHWINAQENKMILKGDLYDAVMELRPE